MNKRIISILVAVICLFAITATIFATTKGQTLGRTNISGVRGHRAYVRVTAPPSNLRWTAGLVAICNKSPCSGDGMQFFETGWIRGTAFGLGNQIRQYARWRKPDGTYGQDYFLGTPLSANTWYFFKVLHSNTSNSWEAWRSSSVLLQVSGQGWTNGVQAASGAEANSDGDWMDVYMYWPEYKTTTNNSWTVFNYGYPQTSTHGCINYAYSYGHRGYSC